MNKSQKRFNWKARQSDTKGVQQLSGQKKLLSDKIVIDFDESKYDSSNPLVLEKSSQKSKTNKKQILPKNAIKTKILSKKQKKKLEKVLERKNRKINRSKLLSDLQEFKAEDKEMALMSSTSDVQTCGRKRLNDIKTNLHLVNEEFDEIVLTKIKKYKKFKKNKTEFKSSKNLNIIGISDNSDDSESDESIDDLNDNNLSEDKNSVELVTKPQKVENKCQNQVLKNSKEEIIDKNITTKQKNIPKEEISSQKREFVPIIRTDEIEKSRSALPIVSEEHTILDAVFNNPVVIVCGETGSGKTTQVPQFLFEVGFANNNQMIGVTEPRRVAAIAMSERVAHEMNVSKDLVSFQIRFESNVTEKTKIKFMTDGVLLKEIQNDFLLNKYSVIIIDEAHERSLFSDILIGLLSRIVPLRYKKQNPLKLIIMSATLRVEDFTTNSKLFKTIPPALKIDSRQFPVSVHFNKKTNSDYLHEAFNKVCKIHRECPNGGILVFLTGRLEVEVLCRRLRAKYPKNATKNYNENNVSLKKNNKNQKNESKEKVKSLTIEKMPAINLDDYEVNPLESERTLDDLDYSDDENEEQMIPFKNDDDEDETFYTESQPLYCLPLYSQLPHSEQSKIFRDPPPGARLCVIATNVAETSLTIPNVKYVVDSGKVKTKVYDNITGISTFIVDWTSKASADQRAGRAGRTGPGHCYRLYSSAIFNDEFKQYSEPELVRKPTDDLVLQMKAMNIENVINFPFPSQPSIEALMASEKRLISMGALKDVNKKWEKSSRNVMKAQITALGKAMAHFPISPRYAKMLALSRQHHLMPYTIAIVSALTIQEMFTNSDLNSKKQNIWTTSGSALQLGDIMVMLNAIGGAQFAGLTPKFCQQNGLKYKAIVEINKLRKQLSSQISQICNDLSEDMTSNLEMSPPNDQQIKLLRQIMLSAFFDRIARKIPVLDMDLDNKEKKKLRNAYQSIEVEKPVFISTHSVLSEELPEYVVYQEMFETTKLQMRNVVAVEPEWLPLFAPNSCIFSNPLETPAPRYDRSSDSIKCFRSATFGPLDWPIKPTELLFPEGLERYKYFAKFLLEGDVIEFFKTYSKHLLSSPTIITKSWARLQPRTERILKSLISETIESRNSLVNKWKSDPNYLLTEYLDWLPKSVHQKVTDRWPPEPKKQ